MNEIIRLLTPQLASLFTVGVIYMTYRADKQKTKHDELLDLYDREKAEADRLRKENDQLRKENDELRKKDK